MGQLWHNLAPAMIASKKERVISYVCYLGMLSGVAADAKAGMMRLAARLGSLA
jgi:hypothetical protein